LPFDTAPTILCVGVMVKLPETILPLALITPFAANKLLANVVVTLLAAPIEITKLPSADAMLA